MRHPKLIAIVGSLFGAIGATAIACGKPAPAPAPADATAVSDSAAQQQLPAVSPLAGLAGQHIVVLPVHYIRADTMGFATRIDDPRATLAALDSAIERALGERGLSRSWTYPPALARSARRNAGYVSDPYMLAAERLRSGVRLKDARLAEPLATQIRGIVAVTDARYALFPVELRFERVADGRMRPVLHVVLLDARGSSVRWVGEVRGTAANDITPTMLESIAFALADLVAVP